MMIFTQDDVCNESHSRGLAFGPCFHVLQHHHALRDFLVRRHSTLYLSELDAEAAQLDLLIDASKELDGVVGEPPTQVA